MAGGTPRISRKCFHASRCRDGNGNGHPGRPRPGVDLGLAPRRQERRRDDFALRCTHVPDEDRRRGQGLPPRATIVDDANGGPNHSRNTKFAIAAAQMAMEDSGLLESRPALDPARFGVYLGSGEGQQDFPRFVKLVHRTTHGGKVDDGRVHSAGAARRSIRSPRPSKSRGPPPATWRALFGAKGPNANCLTACAASSQAIGEAFEIIRRGDVPT